MANANTCIICGQKAGSREHIFPAAFGGRRKDKGIYCGLHNKEFGRHVAALLAELDIFNAVRGVRPDRKNSIRAAPATLSDGSIYMVAKGSVEIPIPPNINENSVFGQEISLSFPNQSDADRWMGEQRKRGYNVKSKGASPVKTQFFTEPLRVQKTFGGTAFMRALLYFGLTYLAHHFPAHARSPGLDAVKAEIQRAGDSPLNVGVWWERPGSLDQLPPSPFSLGHCVTIAIEASGKVTALISLWGAIQFGMELGAVEAAQAIRTVTYIDPLADRPPRDIEVKVEPGASLLLGTPEDGRAYLSEVVSGAVPHPMRKLLDAAGAAQLRDSASALLSRLLAAKELPVTKRQNAMMEAMAGESQRVFFLIQAGIDGLSSMDPRLPKPLEDALQQLCNPDPSAPRGLSKTAEAALHVVLAAFAFEMGKRLDDGVLDVEAVENLIAGGEGIAFAFRAGAKQILDGVLR